MALAPSLLASLENVGETLAISWPTMVDAAVGRLTKQICDDRLRSWAEKLMQHARIDLRVHGSERIAGRTYLVMSNHQSLYDVPVLFVALGSNLRMITKKELFKVPIFGRALQLSGFIAIDREDRSKAVKSLSTAREVIANGTHVWIAPEGTRSKTNELLPFKKGGFALAISEQLPVLPVSIVGTNDALPAKAVRTRLRARVDLLIHPPIEPSDFAGDGVDAEHRERKGVKARDNLLVRVRDQIEKGMADLYKLREAEGAG